MARASTQGKANLFTSNAVTNTVRFETEGISSLHDQGDKRDGVPPPEQSMFTSAEYDDIISRLFNTKPHPAMDRRQRADRRVAHVENQFQDHFSGRKLAASQKKIDEECEKKILA